MVLNFARKLFQKIKKTARIFKLDANKIWRDEYCGLYFNWRLPPKRWHTAQKLHWCFTRLMWRNRKAQSIMTSLLWPFCSIFFCIKKTRQYGVAVKSETGLSLTKQFLSQLLLANAYYMPPRAYYYYGLYRPEKRRLAEGYLHDHEIIALLSEINGNYEQGIFDDKMRFAAECKKFGLKTIPVIAHTANGNHEFYTGVPSEDLFAKPERGKCGQGAHLYRYLPGESATYQCEDGTVLSAFEVLQQITEYSSGKPYMLQKRLRNHSAIAELCQGGLCTCRIITSKQAPGSFKIVCSIFKIPRSGKYTDNFATGGIAVPVEMHSGTLGKGITKTHVTKRIEVHPDTLKTFAGFQLPYWEQTKELCRCAHAAFDKFAMIGWDVAITDEGPVLVEGNLRWGCESLQMAHDRPLVESGFGELYLAIAQA